MKIKHARIYVSRREKPDLTPSEIAVRQISQALKESDLAACAAAAFAMASKIPAWRKCLLVPVPDSHGQTAKNLLLCQALQAMLKRAAILDMLHSAPRESQCQRDRDGRHRYTSDQIQIAVKAVVVPPGLDKAVVCLVDNVCCTGATLEACRRATAEVLPNEICGLVYARTWHGNDNSSGT